MAYVTNFTPEMLAVIEPIMSQLEGKKPYENITVTLPTPQRCQRVRFLIYSWLNYNNLKDLYRLRNQGPLAFQITKRDRSDPLITSREQPHETFVKDNLIDVLDEAEAIEICRTAGLDAPELVRTIETWKRVQGFA
jgi:hypothetical protein